MYKIAESTVTAIYDASKLNSVEKAPHCRSDAVYMYSMWCSACEIHSDSEIALRLPFFLFQRMWPFVYPKPRLLSTK